MSCSTRSMSRPKVQGRAVTAHPGYVAASTSASARDTSRQDQNPTHDFFSMKLFSESSDAIGTGIASTTLGRSFRSSNFKRWDGARRTTTNWDFVRRDPELWFPGGDCLVYFYDRGQSRRGASLRLSLAAIESSNCRPLLERYCAHPVPESPLESSSGSDGGYFTDSTRAGKYELYIPAPSYLGRDATFEYHLTTRNFFAWMFEKPMVGARLGDALISLLERMDLFRPDKEENEDDLLAYLDSQGYTDFRECPDHALSVLQYAEKFQYRELWTDAFVHCVGMYDTLSFSAEFESTSRTTKALITRSHLEMDLRLERAGQALGNFLEDDLSGTYLGLGNDARAHLERFRSFLHTFYVGRYGYWPPARANENRSALPKSTYLNMYLEFRHLYQYLVDETSTATIDNRPANGGICVLQNIISYDQRHKYSSLPSPLPLLPETSPPTGQNTSGFSRFFSSRQTKLDRRVGALNALANAANSYDPDVVDCALVREYLHFEKSWILKEDEKLSSVEARKVRWILIYAVLQALISVTRAPNEVRDTEGVSYPLCCQTAGTPPWDFGAKSQQALNRQQLPKLTKMEVFELPSPIAPDTEYVVRKPSPLVVTKKHRSLSLSSAPKIATSRIDMVSPVPREVSISHKLSVKCPQPQKPGYCEILINGYGNGLDPIDAPAEPSSPSSGASLRHSSGWSASSTHSSDDGMDHDSVDGGNSDYGADDEVDHVTGKNSVRVMEMISISDFRQAEFNPEVELYVAS